MVRHEALLALCPFVVACGTTVIIGDGVSPPPPDGGQAPYGEGGARAPTSGVTGGAGGSTTATTTTTSSTASGGQGGAGGFGVVASTTAGSGGSGGASSSTSSSSGSGGQDGGSVTVGPGFHLVGAYWNGSTVVVDLIDPQTGHGAHLGQLGQLGGWSPNLVLGPDGTRVYGIGNPYGSFVNELVTLDLSSGTWTQAQTAQAQMYALAGVTEDQHVVGVFWNGSIEEVDLVDPATGVGTSVGQLGDLATWPSQLAYDRAANVVYAWGWNKANAQFLYSLDVNTHVSHAIAVSLGNWSYPLGGATPSGAIIGMTWNGAAEVVMTLNPTTGVSTSNGVLAGLHDIGQWGAITYDANTGMAYAIGTPAASNASTLYTLDLATNQGTSVLAAHAYAIARP